MSIYKDLSCVHCGKEFDENDDVVFCPDCGAPHHRSCYLEQGHCALVENHAKGIMYERPKAKAEEQVCVVCPNCGENAAVTAAFCPACGAKLAQATTTAQGAQQGTGASADYAKEQYRAAAADNRNVLLTPVGPVTADELFDDVTAAELAAYIGPNSPKYIVNFKIMKESGKDFSFNWSSFFCNYCFFFYRKMLKPALMLLAIMAIISIPRLMYAQEGFKYYLATYMDVKVAYNMELIVQYESILQILNIFQFALVMTTAVFSNKMYYKHVITEIHKIRVNIPQGTPQDVYMRTLANQGGVNLKMSYGIALLSLLVMMFASYLTLGNVATLLV